MADIVAVIAATRYVQVASMTLILYDHILTTPKEIDFVWRGLHIKSWPRYIFLAARYAPGIVLFTNSTGQAWLLFHGWSGFILFAAVQVISQMRLWAIYRSKTVLYTMTVLILLGLAAMGAVEGIGYNDFQPTNEHIMGRLKICGPGALPPFVYAFWLPPLIIETVSVSLVTYKATQHIQMGAPSTWGGTRFMKSILRYSVIYFVIVLFVYIANFYVWLRLQIPAYELFIPLTFALPSIVGNRMLLYLRGVFYEENAILPSQDTIGMKIVNPDRGLIIETHNPMLEFDSFFGENQEG